MQNGTNSYRSASRNSTQRLAYCARGYGRAVQYLMLIWTENDAEAGTEEDAHAWTTFQGEAEAAGAYVLGSALRPAAGSSTLVRPALADAPPDERVRPGTVSPTPAQVQAFYILDCADDDAAVSWADRLPTWGTVEVRPLLTYG